MVDATGTECAASAGHPVDGARGGPDHGGAPAAVAGRQGPADGAAGDPAWRRACCPTTSGTDELVCQDPYLRNIEKSLFEIVRHADEIGDDIVVDPYFRIPWEIQMSDYGVPLVGPPCDQQRMAAISATRSTSACSRTRTMRQAAPAHPLRGSGAEPAGGSICSRTSSATSCRCAWAGYDSFDPDPGYRPWLGNLYGGLTMDLFKMIGNKNLLYWVYDNPSPDPPDDAADPRRPRRPFRSSSSARVCCTGTPTPGCPARAATGSSRICPRPDGSAIDERQAQGLLGLGRGAGMRADLAEDVQRGLPALHRRTGRNWAAWRTGAAASRCTTASSTLRRRSRTCAASASPAGAIRSRLAELLGKKYVYSRKPTPAYISGPNPDWELVEKDVRDTLTAAARLQPGALFPRHLHGQRRPWRGSRSGST